MKPVKRFWPFRLYTAIILSGGAMQTIESTPVVSTSHAAANL